MQRVLPFGDNQFRTIHFQMADDGVNAYGGYHRVRVKGRLVYLQLLHHYRDREEIAKRVLSVGRHQLGFQAQRVRVQ